MQTSRRHGAFSLVEIVLVIVVLLIVASLVAPRSSSAGSQAEEAAVRMTVAKVRQQIMEHYAAHAAFPHTIDAAWFADGRLPANAFAPGHEHPLLIDGSNDPAKMHPARKTILPTGAFWYNPANGAFRARVPDVGDEARNRALYDSINGTRIAAWDQTTQ